MSANCLLGSPGSHPVIPRALADGARGAPWRVAADCSGGEARHPRRLDALWLRGAVNHALPLAAVFRAP